MCRRLPAMRVCVSVAEDEEDEDEEKIRKKIKNSSAEQKKVTILTCIIKNTYIRSAGDVETFCKRQNSMSKAQTKYWCFTINNPDEQLSFNDDVGFAVWQLEVGDNGTPHFQGYVEFKDSKRLAGCRKALGGRAHVESRRGSQAEAVAYCTKEGTRVLGPWQHGQPSQPRGLGSFVARLRDGTALRTCALEDPETYARNRSACRDFASWLEVRAWREVSCFYLVGDTGCGKSALVYDTFGYENVYTLAGQSPLWFDRYAGQRVLFIDEYEGTIVREVLLRILDGHPFDGPVKGSFTGAQWTVVVIAANNDYFSGFDPALKRRFDRGGCFRVAGRRGDHGRLSELLRGALGVGGRVPLLEAGAPGGEARVDAPLPDNLADRGRVDGNAAGLGGGVPPGGLNFVGNFGWVMANM